MEICGLVATVIKNNPQQCNRKYSRHQSAETASQFDRQSNLITETVSLCAYLIIQSINPISIAQFMCRSLAEKH